VVRALLSLSVNNRGRLEYPTIRNQRKRRPRATGHMTGSCAEVVEGLLKVSGIEGEYLEVGITAEKLNS
jgi:hypothetical protein